MQLSPITAQARVAAVIGDPVAHSMSPRIHNTWLAEHNIDGVYIPLHVTPENLATTLTLLSTIPAALGAIFTSVMIYQDTHRTSWRLGLTLPRFFGTFFSFLTLGLCITHPSTSHIILFALVIFGKMIPELLVLSEAKEKNFSADQHSARLQLGPLRLITALRFALIPLALLAILITPWATLAILLTAEILERQLFFQSCHSPKMPGHFG